MRVDYPPKRWQRRPYQEPAWDYLSSGGRHAEMIWHRRAGKDEVAMYHTGCEMLETPATYWHMLPKSNQVRKAIWESVNPHTGIRRIDEVFPPELFDKREGDMFVRCKHNASTWQCLGSDNYEGAIGSPPKGIVYSEWAQANPSVRGYLRPIILENHGWQIFITTPRGKNHAYSTYHAAKKNPKSFAEILTVHDTGLFTPSELIEELTEYVNTYGEDMGLALYEQEYECSFDAAIMGAYFASEFRRIDHEDRIQPLAADPDYPVHVAMDIGRTDDTAMWFFQSFDREIRVLKYYSEHGRDPSHYISVIAGRDCQINIIDDRVNVEWGRPNEHEHEWKIGSVWLPHDARAKSFATLKSAEEQFAAAFGWGRTHIVPRLSLQDGIQAARMALKWAYFDTSCNDGTEALRSYHRKWDDDKKRFQNIPEHDWASHPSDAWRYLAIAWTQDKLPKESVKPKYALDRSFMEMVESNAASKRSSRDHR